MLGAALIPMGIVLAVVALGVDLIGVGRWGGFGPVQIIGLGGGLFLTVAGGILIRTNGRPA
jgi:hypothetical protein